MNISAADHERIANAPDGTAVRITGFEPVEFAPGLWRGRQPQSQAEYQVLKGLGIREVISLRWSLDWYDRMQACKIGVYGYWPIRMGSILPPAAEKVCAAINVLRSGSGPIYLHCKDGVDRTGFVVAKYRIHIEGWERERAAAEMVAMGNHWWLRWWTGLL